MHEKEEQVVKAQKDRDDTFDELVAERENNFHYQEAYEKLVKFLRSFDFQGCQCMLKTMSEVEKARQYIAKTRLGNDLVAPV